MRISMRYVTEALPLRRHYLAGVAFVDLIMPSMDGIELAMRLRVLHKCLKLLTISVLYGC